MDELLKEFKQRNHIFHDSEDESLTAILNKSTSAIKRLTGSDDVTIPEAAELILERSRYVYNDSLEYFEDNFQAEILGVSLLVNPGDDTDDSKISTPEN